jgi:hypothetical protein
LLHVLVGLRRLFAKLAIGLSALLLIPIYRVGRLLAQLLTGRNCLLLALLLNLPRPRHEVLRRLRSGCPRLVRGRLKLLQSRRPALLPLNEIIL